ncbi:MAG: type II toxin-antitoxin system VapC family toxin [Candidatus Jordarchaeales archaeon]|nr:type II toxin-antitoxin system VapC family toxin [Candidatus Jordarchaeia archaeon]
MGELVVYLDSSSIVKRYVQEPGSSLVRDAYVKAYSAELVIAFSSWNLGEVLGAFDKAAVRGILSEDDYLIVKSRFLAETRRMFLLGILNIIPVRFRLLAECWKLVEKYHIYQADALQIVSAKDIKSAKFITGDKKLSEVASLEGLNAELTA